MDPELRAAALRGDLAALCRALNEGKDPRLADEDGDTVLHYAASNGHVRCVELLALNDADVNARNDYYRTPLTMAAASGHVASIRALLAAGANVNESWRLRMMNAGVPTGEFMDTPTALHWAVGFGTAEAVEVLLAAGASADINAEAQYGPFAAFPTALDQAIKRYEFEAEVIVRGSPRPRPRVRRNRMVPLLVRAGATIKERYADRSDYLKAVLDAGGVHAYERLHRSTLANILNRGNRLPADVIPKIVDYWAHVGWYAIEKDDREYDQELDGPA